MEKLGECETVVVSPDIGGVKRVESFRQKLSLASGKPVNCAFMEKYRSSGLVSGSTLIGDVADKMVIIVDDLISTGGTLLRAAQACRQQGARFVYVAATASIHLLGQFPGFLQIKIGGGTIPCLLETFRHKFRSGTCLPEGLDDYVAITILDGFAFHKSTGDITFREVDHAYVELAVPHPSQKKPACLAIRIGPQYP
jgi:hypothetical protein